MTPVERSLMRIGGTGATPPLTSHRAGLGATSSTAGADPKAHSAAPDAMPPQGVVNPAAGLAALLAQARVAQAQLVTQPLPISNHHSRLVTKLFGG